MAAFTTFLSHGDPDKLSQAPLSTFWSTLRTACPILHRVARSVLAVPAATIDVESLFSTAGQIISPHRCRLGAHQAERLILLKCWLRTSKHVLDTLPELKAAAPDAEWVEDMLAEEGEDLLEGDGAAGRSVAAAGGTGIGEALGAVGGVDDVDL